LKIGSSKLDYEFLKKMEVSFIELAKPHNRWQPSHLGKSKFLKFFARVGMVKMSPAGAQGFWGIDGQVIPMYISHIH
jgi:hypothetical protein